MKLVVRLGLACLLSVAFLAVAVRHADPAAVLASMRGVRWPWVVLATLATGAVQVARAARWRLLAAPFAPLSAAAAWRISNVGNLMVTLLPLRLGELSRPYLMRREQDVSFSSVMGAVAVERAIDGLLVTCLFFCTTAALGPHGRVPAALWAAALMALGIFAGASVALGLALWRVDWLTSCLARALSWAPPAVAARAVELVRAFVLGMRALAGARGLLGVTAWTLAYWGANALAMAWLMRAFGWELPWVAACTLVCVLVIGVMVPAGPGFLGTFQAAIVAGLAIFGVADNDALAFSLVAYPITIGVVVLLGAPYLVGRTGVQMTELLRPAPAGQPSRGRGPWQRRLPYRHSERRRAPR